MQTDEKDLELLKSAQIAIGSNYDAASFSHTVGAAVRCANGRIYTGINVYSVHSICAEHVALGSAMTAGERDFISIVAVRGEKGEEIIPPCGNCRQILSEYAPDCEVMLSEDSKVPVRELLPYAYISEM